MPGKVRHYAVLAAVLACGMPLAAAGVAGASPGSRQVTFYGDDGGTQCRSEPDQARLTVPAESTVTFVNRTGGSAVVRIDGHDGGTVGADQGIPVVFRRGPVSVSLIPECGFGLDLSFGSVTVDVVSAGGKGPTAPPRTRPSGNSDHDIPAQRSTGRVSTPAAATAGVLPPAGSPPADLEINQPTDGTPDVDPVAAPPRGGANSLLALVAVVFVVGAGAALIRAIFAQRASRAIFA